MMARTYRETGEAKALRMDRLRAAWDDEKRAKQSAIMKAVWANNQEYRSKCEAHLKRAGIIAARVNRARALPPEISRFKEKIRRQFPRSEVSRLVNEALEKYHAAT